MRWLLLIPIISIITFVVKKPETYHPHIVPTLIHEHPFLAHESLTIETKAYTADESRLYLDRNLLSRGFQPIQVTIQNNSPHTWIVDGISLPTAHPKHIAYKLSQSALPRAIAFKVATFFFWPMIIPSTIDTLKTYSVYQKMHRDFSAKLLKEGEMIVAYSTLHRMLYVPKGDVEETLSLTFKSLNS